MACKLTNVAPRTFSGTTGSTVQLAIDSDSGAAFIFAATYAGNPLAPPWSFNIVAGPNQLLIVVEDPNAGDPVRIQEVCNGGKQTLLSFNFDPAGPEQGLVIIGK